MPDEARQFDRHQHRYREAIEDSISFSGAGLDFFTRVKADVLLELAGQRVGAPAELAFLDLGCGPGETDRFLRGRVRSLAGADVSAGMVERAREANPWADYDHYPSGGPLPYEDGVFDVAFAICVLHHVAGRDRLGLLQEMGRVCRPGGLVLIFEHNPWNPLTRKAVSDCEFDRDAELLTRRAAGRLLVEAGLHDQRGRYIEFFVRDSPLLRRIERRLGWLPLGAQYVVAAHRP